MPGLDFADDDVLAKALAARDRDAFAFLLDRYHSSLVRLAQQYVPSRAVAEEVVQETWLAVIQGIDRFEGRSSVKTWLFRIARREGVSHRSVLGCRAGRSGTGRRPQTISSLPSRRFVEAASGPLA
jgi:RNA polymerase sigma-70 factor (ECF subfamily)